MRSGNCKLQYRGRPFKNERHKQFISYEMELQIPHRICAEISAQSILWREAQRDRENTETAMRMEKGENRRGRSMSRSCTYASRDTAQNLGFELRRILKGKSSLMIYEQFPNLKFKYRNREFWCRGYYVDTAGKNAKKIEEYIRNQLEEDKMGEQLTMGNF